MSLTLRVRTESELRKGEGLTKSRSEDKVFPNVSGIFIQFWEHDWTLVSRFQFPCLRV